MNRREALRYTTWLAGTGLLVPGVWATLQSCQDSPVGESWMPRELSQSQVNQLINLSDTIIPATTTPSASDVKVHQFVDVLIADVLAEEQIASIKDGLQTIDELSRNETQTAFEKLSSEQLNTLVSQIDQAAFQEDSISEQEARFHANYRYLKALILLTYFTSEEGVKQNLNYVVIPGEYNGCMDLPEDAKVMVGNHM